jgi:hypothetical protein
MGVDEPGTKEKTGQIDRLIYICRRRKIHSQVMNLSVQDVNVRALKFPAITVHGHHECVLEK